MSSFGFGRSTISSRSSSTSSMDGNDEPLDELGPSMVNLIADVLVSDDTADPSPILRKSKLMKRIFYGAYYKNT